MLEPVNQMVDLSAAESGHLSIANAELDLPHRISMSDCAVTQPG